MKIAYVTEYDAKDIHHFSGTGFYIARTLEKQEFNLDYIGGLKESRSHWLLTKGFRLLYLLKGKQYLSGRDPTLAKQYALQINQRLKQSNAEIVFSPGSIPISYLDCRQPIVFWTDATFAGALALYPTHKNISSVSISNGHALEQSALDRCRLALYCSDWAAQSAVNNYKVSPEKIKVVPYGANLEENNSLDDIKRFIESRGHAVCKLLFVGVDWVRKGGAIALQVTERLHQKGFPVTLDIVGCNPKIAVPESVKIHGFLSKASKDDVQLLKQLYSNSHFLVLPSRAEPYGMVLSEASAFGLPSITTNSGGIPSVITDGRNGLTFPLDAPIEDYVNAIVDLWSAPARYSELAITSYLEYRQRLNWGIAGSIVRSLLLAHCK